ncbi:MAG: sulfate adenylyltransferase [Candidatus Nanoarchaeia archaeon]|nr:sulfate adenylyltransferase [Candidatus Nanoarchaeia archaeon]
MIGNIKIICTIGPSSFNDDILYRFKDRGADFFRINLSHTPKEEIEKKMIELKKYGVPVMIDTEGSQLRTGNNKEIEFAEGSIIRIYNKEVLCDRDNLFLTPLDCIQKLSEGDLIHLDFNSVLIKVAKISNLHEGYIEGVVLIGGAVGGRKGVHVETDFKFPAFSEKDLYAFEIAKENGIKNFSLSFIRKEKDILDFKKILPDAFFLTKIETRDAVRNIDRLLDASPGILIDRGDLSREIPLQQIPLSQEYIVKKAREKGKEVFIATNTLENMSSSLKPMRSEVNDVMKALKEGVSGFVLTKETAVGKYPVETLNMMASLIRQYSLNNEMPNLDDVSYGLLPLPHGGKLINREISGPIRFLDLLPKIKISEEEIMDAEQIAIGSFSPLEGFMGKSDFNSVLDNMRLSSGVVWPLPIILQVHDTANLEKGQTIRLISEKDGEVYALMHLEDIYRIDKEEVAKRWFGTSDLKHPGVRRFFDKGDYVLGGKIDLIKRRDSPGKLHELTPRQIRRIFSEKGWSKIVGFHTRNVIHKSHEFIQLEALSRHYCDGLFVHPIIGKKKSGDFEAHVIIESYEQMIKNFYPKGKVFFSVFANYSRYSGPREALFTALVRKNFGCSHFIVGRDHTGVGNFYPPAASHEIFDKFTKEELGIVPIKFNDVFYSESEGKYIHESDPQNFPEANKLQISGTQAREMLSGGIKPPEWFMRPEISKIILDKIKAGEKVFVE